jgi:hypothetical protein
VINEIGNIGSVADTICSVEPEEVNVASGELIVASGEPNCAQPQYQSYSFFSRLAKDLSVSLRRMRHRM